MALQTIFINLLTGESYGEFRILKVRDSNNNMVNILTLLGSGNITGATQPLNISNGILSIDLNGYVTNSALTNSSAAYTDTTNLNLLLAAKQNTLIAGNNITISNNTISSTNLIFQLDGVTQNAGTVNFIQNNALLSNGVLNISRLTHYDKITLIYSTSSTIKDLTQGVGGELL